MRRLARLLLAALCMGLVGASPATAAPGYRPAAHASAGPATPQAGATAQAASTRMLAAPAISADRIAFLYAGDMWTADRDGQNVRRLTIEGGVEQEMCHPEFSPDGAWLTYSARRDGNLDVYIMSSDGGQARQLTWHPGPDCAQGFTPDGKAVLFTSDRAAPIASQAALYTVSVTGGFPQGLPAPPAAHAAYAPDGKTLAYNPLPDAFTIWKGYRGGQVSTISLYAFAERTAAAVRQPAGRSNDVGPMWVGDRLFFRSDRDGEFNIYSYDPATRAVRRWTDHQDFPVLNAAAGGGKIVYEQAGVLHLLDPQTGGSSPLDIRVAVDLPQLRESYVPGAYFIRNADISPSGARAVFEMRGEIVTVPAQRGETRNITNSPGVAERSPAWSPDGQWIAYFSDASGEYELQIRSQDGQGEPQKFKLDGAGFYDAPSWSPDGTRLAYRDQACTLYWLDLASGETHKVAHDAHCWRARNIEYTWSPDGRWIAYTLSRASDFKDLYLYDTDDGSARRVTDGMADVSGPAFDLSGRYLYFAASVDAGPGLTRMDMTGFGQMSTTGLYVALLRADVPSPYLQTGDEEIQPQTGAEPTQAPTPTPTPAPVTPVVEAAGPGLRARAPAAAGQRAAGSRLAVATITPTPTGREVVTGTLAGVSIDFDGLADRILPLPVTAQTISNVRAGGPGQVLYLKGTAESGSIDLCRFSIEDQSEDEIAKGVFSYWLSLDRSRYLAQERGGWMISRSAGGSSTGSGPDAGLPLDVALVVEPELEWQQMYQEAWRINRDFFYDPNLYGIDWESARQKYAQFLPDIPTREDLTRVMGWLLSELRVGHHFVAGPGWGYSGVGVDVGLLGADYTLENGRYRLAKVYGRQLWSPDIEAPLAEPGAEVAAGEYILAVNGQPLTADDNIYRRFQNLSGKLTRLTVGPNPDLAGSRTVQVKPINDETQLRHLDWVESNRRYVDQASRGRVAYVYLPDTSEEGFDLFRRYFFPQADRQAIVVDDRYNIGGQYADYILDLLRRQGVAGVAYRGGADMRVPSAYISGPKVMLINEASASGGDLLPWAFRKLGLGKLIGKRTWGGLVGVSSYPVLLDGGRVTAPDFGMYDENGWIVENEGVAPDIEVEQTAADVVAGKDSQLERAVQYLLDQLAQHPPTEPQHPAYPVKTGR